jgi:hypothetical protein
MSTTTFGCDASNRHDDEGDTIENLGQISFYDEKNPVREWMKYGRSNREPVLDEEDEDSDIPILSQLVRDQIDPKDLQTATVMIALMIGHEEMWVAVTLGRGCSRVGLSGVTQNIKKARQRHQQNK